MDNTLQLYIDDEKKIKGYPITSPDRVVDEKGRSVQHEIKKITEQMDSKVNKDDIAKISNGTPLFASNVVGMTDITRNYVNTTDGYLYVYGNGKWIKTNVKYQETGLSGASIINIFKLASNQTKLKRYKNLLSYAESTDDTGWYYKIPIVDNNIITVSGSTGGVLIKIYDYSKTLITQLSNSNLPFTIDLTIYNELPIYIDVLLVANASKKQIEYGSKVTEYEQEVENFDIENNKNNIETIKNDIRKINTIISPYQVKEYKNLLSYAESVDDAGWYYKIPVKPSCKLTVSGIKDGVLIKLYDHNKTLIDQKSNLSLPFTFDLTMYSSLCFIDVFVNRGANPQVEYGEIATPYEIEVEDWFNADLFIKNSLNNKCTAYDSFQRADGRLGISDSGQIYEEAGDNEECLFRIVDKHAKLGSLGNAYMSLMTKNVITDLEAKWYYEAGTDSSKHSTLAFVIYNTSKIQLNKLMHFITDTETWNLQIRQNYTDLPIVLSGRYNTPLKTDGTILKFNMKCDRVNNRIILELPDGTTAIKEFNKDLIEELCGTRGFWQVIRRDESAENPIFTYIALKEDNKIETCVNTKSLILEPFIIEESYAEQYLDCRYSNIIIQNVSSNKSFILPDVLSGHTNRSIKISVYNCSGTITIIGNFSDGETSKIINNGKSLNVIGHPQQNIWLI